jgi:Uri superfamily endonuclease
MPDYSNINDYIHEQANDFLFDIIGVYDLLNQRSETGGRPYVYTSFETKENPTVSNVEAIIKEWDKDISNTEEFNDNLHYHIDTMLDYYGVAQDIYFNSFWSMEIQETNPLSDEYRLVSTVKRDHVEMDSGYYLIMGMIHDQIYTWAKDHFRKLYDTWRLDKDKSSWFIDYIHRTFSNREEREQWEDVIYGYYDDKDIDYSK